MARPSLLDTVTTSSVSGRYVLGGSCFLWVVCCALLDTVTSRSCVFFSFKFIQSTNFGFPRNKWNEAQVSNNKL